MQLTLQRVAQQVGAETHLHPLDLELKSGAVTVLLGATQAGKTTLMRVMAGLDRPSAGRVRVDGRDVTGMPVRQRNVAMVYQQFINYPSMSVFDNIASPLRLRREAGIEGRVRALAKGAPLMLLDEPLVNLDYKLREELREELTQLFAAGDSTVVYATTEPTEALLLGGHTAVLDAGELLQYGPTAEVFRRPGSIRVARAFSDPPMNLIAALPSAGGVRLHGGIELPLALAEDVSGAGAGLSVGVRAGALRLVRREGDVAIDGVVELAEISGSDTFVHLDTPAGELVAQLVGVHDIALGARLTLWLAPRQVYVFDGAGHLRLAPEQR